MKFMKILMAAALWMAGLHLYAQSFGLEYTTELQSDFGRGVNFVNLLELSTELPITQTVSLEANTISIGKTRQERLLDDLQTFSNIEEDNLRIALSVANFAWQINDRHTLYAGIRNVNEDYFTSPVTSLFTNSSCGIFPTLSCNYPLANYPLSSVGFHYIYSAERFGIQASIYNGRGYNRFYGRENIWRFTPHSDGLFSIAQTSYQLSKQTIFLGGCLYAEGEDLRPVDQDSQRFSSTLWTYTEREIFPNIHLIADYSHAFGPHADCSDFLGIGTTGNYRKYTLGLFADYAHFRTTSELAIEFTSAYQLNSRCNLQASFHFIDNTHCQTVGLLRLTIKL